PTWKSSAFQQRFRRPPANHRKVGGSQMKVSSQDRNQWSFEAALAQKASGFSIPSRSQRRTMGLTRSIRFPAPVYSLAGIVSQGLPVRIAPPDKPSLDKENRQELNSHRRTLCKG